MNDQLVFKRGGKLEITDLLSTDPVIGKYIPKSTSLTYEETQTAEVEVIKILRDRLADIQFPVYMRGSIQGDEDDLIDVIPTYWANTMDDLLGYMSIIRNSAESDENLDYARFLGYSEFKPHLLIQEAARYSTIGSMLRHPHTGNIYLEYKDKKPLHWGETNSVATFYQKWNSYYYRCNVTNPANQVTESQAFAMFELMKLVEQRLTFWENDTLQLEVTVGDAPQILQARRFREKSETCFELPYNDNSIINSRVCFGITPESGILLPFYKYDGYVLPQSIDKTKPYGLILADRYSTISTEQFVSAGPNLTVVISASDPTNFLSHNDYRAFKHVPYSCCAESIPNRTKLASIRNARYFSNGDESILVPETES